MLLVVVLATCALVSEAMYANQAGKSDWYVIDWSCREQHAFIVMAEY